jgi:hypothetical protein
MSWTPPRAPRYGGESFNPVADAKRLNKQCAAVHALMQDGNWRTPSDIEAATGFNWASASARLRDLRKPQFGAFRVERRRKGDAERGLYEYRMLPPEPKQPDLLTPIGFGPQHLHERAIP